MALSTPTAPPLLLIPANWPAYSLDWSNGSAILHPVAFHPGRTSEPRVELGMRTMSHFFLSDSPSVGAECLGKGIRSSRGQAVPSVLLRFPLFHIVSPGKVSSGAIFWVHHCQGRAFMPSVGMRWKKGPSTSWLH